MDEYLTNESQRCLLCRKARCSMACPVHTDVPGCMELVRAGQYEEAGALLFRNNPFSMVTSRICDWQRLCFGHCVLQFKHVPIHWYPIEQRLSEAFLSSFHPRIQTVRKEKVAVIGAGPAGLTAAFRLRELGYPVTLYDKHPDIGGVLRYGIPDFRLDRKYMEHYDRLIQEYGIDFRGSCRIGRQLSLDDIRSHADATLIASGAGKPRRLSIPGEDNNPRILYALDFLEHPDQYELKGKVLVIGGGNVTMDASRTAVRKGCDTYVYYRKTFENMPANASEVEDAKRDGVQFVVFEVPVAIREENIAVMRKCENILDGQGKVGTRMIEGTDHEVPFDHMIVAISEQVDSSVFGSNPPASDSKGWPETGGYQQTSFPDVFLAGDFLTGPKTVVDAVASGKLAAEGIHCYLTPSSSEKH